MGFRPVLALLALSACSAESIQLPTREVVTRAEPIDCAAEPTPSNPTTLVALSSTPGVLQLTWDEAPGTPAYLACAGARCEKVRAASACAQGRCVFDLTGLENDARVTATVRGANACVAAAAEGAPAVSTTAVNALLVGGDGFDVDSSCTPSAVALTTGEIRVDQRDPDCLTFLELGDSAWGDHTAVVELFVPSAIESPALVGLVQQVSGSGHAVLAGVAVPNEGAPGAAVALRRPGQAVPSATATSLFRLPPATWVALRLVAVGGAFSLQAALPGAAFEELLRWPSPLPGAAAQTGRTGLAIWGAGKARFRHFRLSTAAELPPPGPASIHFTLPGLKLPQSWVLGGVAPPVDRVPCPVLPAATECRVEGGCTPSATLGCASLSRTGMGMGGTAAFDFPVGIDVTRPWSLSLRFAALEGTFISPRLLSTSHGALLEVNGGPEGKLVSAGTELLLSLELGRWHVARWTFVPQEHIDLELDRGAPMRLPWPESWDRHPGAFFLSSPFPFSYFEAFVTDIAVSQP